MSHCTDRDPILYQIVLVEEEPRYDRHKLQTLPEKTRGQILDLGGWLHDGNIFNAVGWSSRLNCTAAEYAARLDQRSRQ
jgi:hypothetical protein